MKSWQVRASRKMKLIGPIAVLIASGIPSVPATAETEAYQFSILTGLCIEKPNEARHCDALAAPKKVKIPLEKSKNDGGLQGTWRSTVIHRDIDLDTEIRIVKKEKASYVVEVTLNAKLNKDPYIANSVVNTLVVKSVEALDHFQMAGPELKRNGLRWMPNVTISVGGIKP